jgi:uncharacterized membrane protein YqaE (UPF0057 family)
MFGAVACMMSDKWENLTTSPWKFSLLNILLPVFFPSVTLLVRRGCNFLLYNLLTYALSVGNSLFATAIMPIESNRVRNQPKGNNHKKPTIYEQREY